MKKKSLLIFYFALATSCSSHRVSKDDILQNTNIAEIEEYLKNTHSDDPKRHVLKSKLIALKNSEWTKGAANAKPMEVRPVISEIPQNFKTNSISKDSEEFKKLMSETSSEHKEKTVKLLNAMLSENINSKEAILLFRNNSDCNLVLKISGNKFYNLPVASHDENFIVVEKDLYSISGNVCDVKYISQKQINKNIQIVLNNPEYKKTTKNLKPKTRTGRDTDK